MPQKQIFIGDQVLHGPSRAGEWIVEELAGWHEPPNPKGATADRINAHGEIDVLDYYAARMVTVSGILFHKTRAYGIGAVEALGAAMSLDSQKLVVTDAGITRWAEAKLAGLDWTEAARSAMRFQARFKCVDPFKYGQLRTINVASGVQGSVHHRGTTEAWPVVTVTGNLPDGYTLTFRSQQVSVPMGLTPGITHRIEYKTRRLYVNGEVFFGAFGKTDFRSMAPGVRRSFDLTCPTGSGTAKVELVDTFI